MPVDIPESYIKIAYVEGSLPMNHPFPIYVVCTNCSLQSTNLKMMLYQLGFIAVPRSFSEYIYNSRTIPHSTLTNNFRLIKSLFR